MLIHTSGDLRSKLVVQPDPENMSISVGISLLSRYVYELRYMLFPLYFRLMAAIFDFRHTQTSAVSPLVSPCCRTPKTWVHKLELCSNHAYKAIIYGYFQFGGCHFGIPLPFRSCNVLDCPSGQLDFKNIDIAFKMMILSCLQADIWVHPVWRPPSWICHFRFLPVWSCNIATDPIVQLDP